MVDVVTIFTVLENLKELLALFFMETSLILLEIT